MSSAWTKSISWIKNVDSHIVILSAIHGSVGQPRSLRWAVFSFHCLLGQDKLSLEWCTSDLLITDYLLTHIVLQTILLTFHPTSGTMSRSPTQALVILNSHMVDMKSIRRKLSKSSDHGCKRDNNPRDTVPQH